MRKLNNQITTQKEREEKNKQKRDAIKQHPDFKRLQMLLSLNYLMHNHSLNNFDDIEDILKRNNLKVSKTISLGRKLDKAYNEYFLYIREWMGGNSDDDLLKDMTRFEELADEFMVNPHMKADKEDIAILMRKYIDNREASEQLKKLRVKFNSENKCEVGVGCIGGAVQDMCGVCKKRHEYHTEIVRLGRANGGIMKTIKRLTK